MLKIKWTDAALQDLDEALTFIAAEKQNPVAATKIARRIYDTSTLLRETLSLALLGASQIPWKSWSSALVTQSGIATMRSQWRYSV